MESHDDDWVDKRERVGDILPCHINPTYSGIQVPTYAIEQGTEY